MRPRAEVVAPTSRACSVTDSLADVGPGAQAGGASDGDRVGNRRETTAVRCGLPGRSTPRKDGLAAFRTQTSHRRPRAVLEIAKTSPGGWGTSSEAQPRCSVGVSVGLSMSCPAHRQSTAPAERERVETCERALREATPEYGLGIRRAACDGKDDTRYVRGDNRFIGRAATSLENENGPRHLRLGAARPTTKRTHPAM
jgi:hypothetical protein